MFFFPLFYSVCFPVSRQLVIEIFIFSHYVTAEVALIDVKPPERISSFPVSSYQFIRERRRSAEVWTRLMSSWMMELIKRHLLRPHLGVIFHVMVVFLDYMEQISVLPRWKGHPVPSNDKCRDNVSTGELDSGVGAEVGRSERQQEPDRHVTALIS